MQTIAARAKLCLTSCLSAAPLALAMMKASLFCGRCMFLAPSKLRTWSSGTLCSDHNTQITVQGPAILRPARDASRRGREPDNPPRTVTVVSMLHQRSVQPSTCLAVLQEIRILGEGGLVASQGAQTVLSLAACWHSSIVVAYGSSVQTFAMDPACGELQPGVVLEHSHQISALSIVELPGAGDQVSLQEAQCPTLATALLLLVCSAAPQPCRLSLKHWPVCQSSPNCHSVNPPRDAHLRLCCY